MPAVVVATAAPALAASPAACGYTFVILGLSCRYMGPGNSYYQVGFRVDRDLSCASAPVNLNVTVTGSPTPATATGTATFGQGVGSAYVENGPSNYRLFLNTEQSVTSVSVTYTIGSRPPSQPVTFDNPQRAC